MNTQPFVVDYGSLGSESYEYMARGFPKNRADALSWAYRLSAHDAQQDMPQGTTTTGPVLQPEDIPAPFTGTASTPRPVMHYLKMEPVQGPTGQINLTAVFLCEYWLELECEHVAAGVQFNVTVGNSAATDLNMPYIRGNWGIVNPKSTYGANRTSFQFQAATGKVVKGKVRHPLHAHWEREEDIIPVPSAPVTRARARYTDK